MTKIALITDIHFGARNDLPIFLDFQKKFFNQVFFPKLDELGIKTVVNLGDTFDRRKYINFNTLHRAKDMFFDPLAQRNIWSPTIIGNHDTFHKNTNKVNSMELVCNEFHYPNLKIINDPQVVDVDGFPIVMIPWICQDNYLDCYKLIETAETDLCMGHFAVNGFVMHVGQVAEEGVNREIFDRYDMVFSGHFHHRSSDGRIHYLGSPSEMTWQDFGDTKGFHILDLETRRLQFIPNPFQMFHRIIYNDETFDYFNQEDMAHYTNAYVKVVVEKKSDATAFDTFMQTLYDVNPYNVSVVQNYADVIEISEDFMIDQSSSSIQMIHSYIENAKLQAGLEPDKMKNMFTDIYNEAVNVES